MKEKLVSSLKSALRVKGITYKDLAKSLSLSEASIKRIFSDGSFSLDRFLEICEVAGVSPESLFGLADEQSTRDHEYTSEQEDFFAANPQHLAFFDLLLKDETPKQIARRHGIEVNQMQKFLRDLEKIDLLEWLPKDRIKLRISKNVRWRKGGRLKRELLPLAKKEFLSHNFDELDSENQFLLIDLSEKSQKKLRVRIEELLVELSKDASIDQLAKSKRQTIGLFLAYRPWNFSLLKSPRR